MSIKLYQLTTKFHSLGIQWDKIYGMLEEMDLYRAIEDYKSILGFYSNSSMSPHTHIHSILMDNIHESLNIKPTIKEVISVCSDSELFSYSWEGGMPGPMEFKELGTIDHLKLGFIYTDNISYSESFHPKVIRVDDSGIHNFPDLFVEVTPLQVFTYLKAELDKGLYTNKIDKLNSPISKSGKFNEGFDPLLNSTLLSFLLSKNIGEFPEYIRDFITYFSHLKDSDHIYIDGNDINMNPQLANKVSDIISNPEYYSMLTVDSAKDISLVIDNTLPQTPIYKNLAKIVFDIVKEDSSISELSKYLDLQLDSLKN